MKARRILGLFGFTLITAVVAVVIYAKFIQPETKYIEIEPQPAVRNINLPAPIAPQAMDFTDAAESTVHAVVHVKTTMMRETDVNPLYEFFFGEQQESGSRPVMGFGSGVIISDDGYIVTNNHVIDGSDEIEVTMNDRRTFTAKLVGADPDTDIALLKIDEKNLPTIEYGNSDNLRLGEWVLAVGNPYNLTSTVTAGIVSAKARDINIMRGAFSIETFIQTDAAVNPGNSGGALVNTSGELIGINTAIASRTGAYTGYSFAIPVSLVQKVVGDLMEFGEVQRALLGVVISDVTAEIAKEEGLEDTKGVYVAELSENGAAKEAGIKKGDVISSINGTEVNTGTELQEQVSKYRPNDKIKVELRRKGNHKEFEVVLRNRDGNTDVVQTSNFIEAVGASFDALTTAEKDSKGIKNGIKVSDIRSGKFKEVGVRKGYIVILVNKMPVNTVNDISDVLRDVEGGVLVEGIYDNGKTARYVFGMD
jgi:serine protease Do